MISVVMGVHRFDEFIKPAIQSILDQTFKDFEFIIVANGSEADSIIDEINNIFPFEERMVYIKTQIGQLAHALNIGIDAAKYDYIARMDADDIAYPSRLEKQINHLKDNNLEVLGTNIRLVDENGGEIGLRAYPEANDINKLILFKNCFAHNTVIFTKEAFIKARGYNAGFNSEDYDLWLRMRRNNTLWDNIQEPLLDYRIHSMASQRRLLGYAESTSYSVREFILKKTFVGFFAIFFHLIKSVVRPNRSKNKT